MKISHRYQYPFLMILFIVGIFSWPTLSEMVKEKNFCEVPSDKPFRISVQPNSSIYGKIFGDQNCSPHRLILRLPANAIIQSQGKNSFKNQRHTPKISTILTFSRQPETFYIRRIDQLKDGLYFSAKDSCSAAKWSSDQEQGIIHVSIERNLLINDPDIEGIIFIVSLPAEMRETKPKIVIDRYTWDRAGDKDIFRLREYPNFALALKENDKLKNNESYDFSSGEKVKKNLSNELFSLVYKGGVYIEKDVAKLSEVKDQIVKYDRDQLPYSCAVPKDWNS
ncbi:hypothetical protein BJP34_22640 [Moorena producens PAL-8-15-08-1]|uniref:Uncharacterized protein n=1 Tax=Moorena producens PAL-8-15-08-1 TaxID=1458985 RepID=A0A1D8TW25_9CYAN|nr:hypothetical protein [Moorena producens]AOX01861.1 hypothetical protein BJP34_22640 [Moorena producens PAL-8-15-08-1]